jgi:hypothetical protein
VDIFSLGVIMYETFLMCPMLDKVSKSGNPDEFEIYAKLVSLGTRQPLKPSWPDSLKVLRLLVLVVQFIVAPWLG